MAKKKKTPEQEIVESPIPEYLKDEFEKLEKTIKDKIKLQIKACFNDENLMKMLLDNQEKTLVFNQRKINTLIEKKFNKMIKTLEAIMETNEMVEDTLRNVLLAIRQNEYLQAWYPPQQGHPEMKVVGRHPIVAKRKAKK